MRRASSEGVSCVGAASGVCACARAVRVFVLRGCGLAAFTTHAREGARRVDPKKVGRLWHRDAHAGHRAERAHGVIAVGTQVDQQPLPPRLGLRIAVRCGRSKVAERRDLRRPTGSRAAWGAAP
eukprot:5509201-Prymnesium_polylepis.2